MKKAVAYCMTRNLYPNIMPSLKSLLLNGNIDEVYLLIEDDDIGLWLPDNVHCINVSGQKWIRKDSPNYNSKWTYMVMMKVVMSELFPRLSRILTLDVDTIVVGSISGLWDMDMKKYCVAGAREPYWTEQYGYNYINGGVMFWNLNRMRSKKTDLLVNALNTKKYKLTEQDCINEQLQGEIKIIDGAYNQSRYTDPPQERARIIHFAAMGQQLFMEQGIAKDYAQWPWDDIVRR